jgi:hypothetical protein
MFTQTSGLAQLRSHFTSENRDLFRVLLNATSAAEANLALMILTSEVPERALVTACNLREVLQSMPVSPFSMCVDEQILIRTAHLEKRMATLGKVLPDGLELVVTTAGNLVLDLIVKDGTTKYFWTPVPVVDDFVNPDVVDLIVESDHLFDEAIELVKCMGVVFNPLFYLSLDDFTLEHASDAVAGLGAFFQTSNPFAISQPSNLISEIAASTSPGLRSTPRHASSIRAVGYPSARASSAVYFTQ